MSGSAAPASSDQIRQIYAQNAAQRNWCVQNGLEMSQPIDTRTLAGTIPGQQVTIPLRPVGLLKRLVVEVSFNLAQTAAETLTRTALGPANIFSNITFFDLNNNTRISCSGWYLTIMATVRRGSAYGANFTNDTPFGMGTRNYAAQICPSTVTTAQIVRFFYEVPISYSNTDLRGAIPLATTGATAQLQLTVNPNIVVGSGVTDATEAVFQSSTGAVAVPTNFTITTYQEYLDQIPPGMIPIIDVQSIYNLQTTPFTSMAVGQDFAVQYGNQREFYSTTAWYDNNGALDGNFDINYWALLTANITNVWKKDPWKAAMDVRGLLGNDMPAGMAYFDHRNRPINTAVFGNMQLIMNPKTVNSATGSILKIGWEFFTMVQYATQLTSLASS
jgi:hypothetical protein